MKKTLMFSAMFLAFTVGAFAVDVKTDFDHSANFSKYQTFAWKAPSASNGIVNNSIVTARIQTAVDEKLVQKGIRENDANPNLYLVAHVGPKNMTDIDYLPSIGGWRHWGWMRSDPIVNRYVEGTVIIDMVDARTNQLVWRAISTDTGANLIQVQSPKNIDKMVGDAFKHFPPVG